MVSNWWFGSFQMFTNPYGTRFEKSENIKNTQNANIEIKMSPFFWLIYQNLNKELSKSLWCREYGNEIMSCESGLPVFTQNGNKAWQWFTANNHNCCS